MYLLCYIDSIILQCLEFNANISLVGPIYSCETDFPQKSAREEEYGGQCLGLALPSVSQVCKFNPGQWKRTTATNLNKMPYLHGRQANSPVMTLQCAMIDISTDPLRPWGTSQLDQRQCQLNSKIENAFTWKSSRRIHTKQLELFSCVT